VPRPTIGLGRPVPADNRAGKTSFRLLVERVLERPPRRASVPSSGVSAHLHLLWWQLLDELIVTVAMAVAEPLAPVQVTE